MNYGSSVDETGKEIGTGSGKIPVMVGERVAGHELISFDFSKVFGTEEVMDDRAELVFKQSNGAFFRAKYFKSDDPKAVARTSAALLHIFSKYMTKERYYELLGSPKDFSGFVTTLRDKIVPEAQATGLKLTLKITYNKKGYVGLPGFPDFAEVDGTNPSTLRTNPKYDFYVAPVQADVTEESQELPF